MKGPESVLLFGQNMTVRWLPDGHEELANLAARFRSGPLRIDIDADMAPDQVRETLLHEILHAILHLTGYDRKGDEGMVQMLGVALLQLIRSNPQLVRWLAA